MMWRMHTELRQRGERGDRGRLRRHRRGGSTGRDVARAPGRFREGMRVGDVPGRHAISGMQGVLVDVTGQGPPYSLMQKGGRAPRWRGVTRRGGPGDGRGESAARQRTRRGALKTPTGGERTAEGDQEWRRKFELGRAKWALGGRSTSPSPTASRDPAPRSEAGQATEQLVSVDFYNPPFKKRATFDE